MTGGGQVKATQFYYCSGSAKNATGLCMPGWYAMAQTAKFDWDILTTYTCNPVSLHP
jgi:hypothetical protein